MNSVLKWVFRLLGAGFLVFVGYMLFTALTFSFDFGSGKQYTTQDLISNYQAKTKELNELKVYVNSIVPANTIVDIEFEDNKNLRFFRVANNHTSGDSRDININNKKVDSLLSILGWTRQTLQLLKQKLDAANCISVKSGEPFTIGFQRSGMGKYYYNLFTKPIPKENRNNYNDSCTYITYNDTLVLEYGGGAVGPQCFPTK